MKSNRLNLLLLKALVCALFTLPLAARALDPAKSVFQFNCQNWSRQNGLPADQINTIVQTGDGYIWMGTENGLLRFDGFEFKHISVTLPEAKGQNVIKISPSKNGGFWFAISEGAFGAYDGQKFSAIPDARWNQPAMNAMTILEARDGVVWTGAYGGLGHWVNGKPDATFLDATNGIPQTICEGHNGRIWISIMDHGLWCWTDGKLVQMQDDFLKHHYIFAVAEDSENHIWVGTDSGLKCYDLKGQVIKTGDMGYEVRALLIDSHGILWVGMTGGGLGRYQDGQFTYFHKYDGLANDDVTSLFEDAEGSLWVGTRDGLSQLTDVKFPIYSQMEGLATGSSHTVTASSKGGLWITTSSGFSYYDGKDTCLNYTNLSFLPNPYVKLGFEARNGDFFTVDGNKNFEVFSHDAIISTNTNSVWPTIFAEDDKSVLVGIGTNLYRYRNSKLEPYAYKEPAPDYYWINCLCVAKDGTIWVGSSDGVYSLKNGRVQRFAAVDGLSSDRVQWLSQDEVDGTIWVGLNTGISRIKDGKIKNIREENGLADERIYAMVPDDAGYFWINSGRGIFRVTRQSLNNFANGLAPRVECELFEGLESVKSTVRTDQEYSGCKTKDGRIWFPNPLGVVSINPTNFFVNPVAPPVRIEEININGAALTNRQPTSLRPGKGSLGFRFAALSFIAPKKVKLRYQLAGFDPDWIDAGERRSANYNDLRPGKYTFRVQACNADGVWNTAGASFSVEFPPHFYQTIWFYFLCGLLGVLSLFGAYRWKVRLLKIQQNKLRSENDLLEARVGERTSELAKANAALHEEIVEREKLHRQLVDASRRAGMAEVATGVLHNVGNVLNSVNVSAAVIADTVRNSQSAKLMKVAELMRDPKLAGLLVQDIKGKHLLGYIETLATHLNKEKDHLVEELKSLSTNIDHIKEIVAMQQSNARLSGVTEVVPAAALVEDALRISSAAFVRHNVSLVRQFDEVPPVLVDRHKVLQILINLFNNAKYACDESGRSNKEVKAWIQADSHSRIKIGVTDNGVGIEPGNLTRIFAHGFTTRQNGHGFGLHSGALAARELGGSLTAFSDGPGKGASFILELPVKN